MSTPANFNGARPVIDVNDTAMLLIDHQSGLFQTVGDMPMPELRARAAALAKMASLAGIPVITTASVPQGPNGPLIPEIHENAPHAKYIARKGEINAWDNPEFVAAVKATGRKTLIIAGTITSVCMAFPAIAAVADGYKVFFLIGYGLFRIIVEFFRQPDAQFTLIKEEAAVRARVRQFLQQGTVTTFSGNTLSIRARSILVHSDTPGSLALATLVRSEIEACGATVASAAEVLAQ